MKVSRTTAVTMNTLNILAPVLLLAAVVLACISRFGDNSPQINQLLTEYAAILTVTAIFIRILWGIVLRQIRKSSK